MSVDLVCDRREHAADRAQQDRLLVFERIARIVIMRRAELGLSQGEFASLTGVTAETVARIESGQRTTSEATLKRLAILGIDLGDP